MYEIRIQFRIGEVGEIQARSSALKDLADKSSKTLDETAQIYFMAVNKLIDLDPAGIETFLAWDPSKREA